MDFETAATFYIASNTALYALQKREAAASSDEKLALAARHGANETLREHGRNAEGSATLLRLYQEGRLRPEITARFPLEQAARAQRLLLERRASGRVVLITGR